MITAWLCPFCFGSGINDDYPEEECGECNAWGFVEYFAGEGYYGMPSKTGTEKELKEWARAQKEWQ